MRTARETPHRHAGSNAGLHAVHAVLDDNAARSRHAQPPCSQQEQVRRRLSVRHIVSGKNLAVEHVPKTKRPDLPVQFQLRARRRNCLGTAERAGSIGCARNGPDVRQDAPCDLGTQLIHEAGRKWPTLLGLVDLIEGITPTLHREPLQPGPVFMAVKKKPDALQRIELYFMCDRF